jgi:hypothetical protein
MRTIIALALLALASTANAGTYVVVCTAPCTAPDGTTQPAGTAVNRIVADPDFNPGDGLSLVADDGRPIYAPTTIAPTTIDALSFIRRFTSAERLALMSADPVWGVMIAAAGQIDVTNAELISDIQAAVTAGGLTQARATQILDLTRASP